MFDELLNVANELKTLSEGEKFDLKKYSSTRDARKLLQQIVLKARELRKTVMEAHKATKE